MASVMIVDDDPRIRRVLGRIIELEGHTGFEAVAGSEFMAEASLRKPFPLEDVQAVLAKVLEKS